MTKLDQFESAFKSASKAHYQYAPVSLRKVLIVSDLDEYQATLFGQQVRRFLRAIDRDDLEWQSVYGDQCELVGGLLETVETSRPDLVCTYRNLYSGAWRWPFSLGDHVDVLTQTIDIPVLLLPRPDDGVWQDGVENTDRVMAITDHLTGDDRLVSFAVAMTDEGGQLFVSHVEDEASFERYMEVIGKLPSIETESARRDILAQLLKEPRDYIASCAQALEEAGVNAQVNKVVVLGTHLAEYVRLIAEYEIDLLVFNTKDEDQLAMHGLAYPLAVDLRSVPLLLL